MKRVHLVALALVACGGAPEAQYAQQAGYAQVVETNVPPPIDMDALIASVTQVRGLALREKVPVKKMSDAEFEQAFRVAYEVPDGVPTVATKDPKFFDGFYSFTTKAIFMRAQPKSRDGDLRIVLAHEIVHALQQQHFHIDGIKADTVDGRLAFLSLVEGDAQVTAYGAVAALDRIPPARVMISTSALHADDHAAVALPEVAALGYAQRQQLVFPYEEGERFVGTLYRAGGFELVNRAYGAPPMTSSQVLHPDAYLAGRVPRPIAPLAFSKALGAEPTGGGRIGEAGLRAVLVDLGITPASAESAAAAWRGDYFSFAKMSGTAVASGVVAMASEPDAQAFAQFIASKGTAARKGDVVSFTIGLNQQQSEKMIAEGFAKVSPQPLVASPFGAVKIPPAPVPLERQARFGGTFNGQVFADPGVGLVVPVPGAYRVTINGEGALVSMVNGMNAMALILIDAGQTPWARAQSKHLIMLEAQKLGQVIGVADQMTPSPFGNIPERTISLADGRYFHVAFAPICGGRATVMIIRLAMLQTWSMTSGILYTWMNSIDARGVEASDFCRAVHEEWDG